MDEARMGTEVSGDNTVQEGVVAAITRAREADRAFSSSVVAMTVADADAVTRMLNAHKKHERALLELGTAVLAVLTERQTLLISLEPGEVPGGLKAEVMMTPVNPPHMAQVSQPIPAPTVPPVNEEPACCDARAPEPALIVTEPVPAEVASEQILRPSRAPTLPGPPPAPATPEDLQALQARFASGRRDGTAAPTRQTLPLRTLAEQWGTPKELSPKDCEVLAPRLLEAAQRLNTWLELPPRTQRQLLTYAVTRARHVQEATGGRESGALDQVFRLLTSFSSEHRPGFVHGLALSHRPQHRSWALDAAHAWAELGFEPAEAKAIHGTCTMGELIDALRQGIDKERLNELVVSMVDHPEVDQGHLEQVLEPHIGRLGGHKKIKRLKKRIAKNIKAKQRSTKNNESERPPDDWGWWAYTRNKRVAVVGGDNRHGARRKLMNAFECESLTWESGWDVRRVASLVESIQAGKIDLVLMIRRFIKHKVSEVVIPACKEAGVVFVPVANGYGVRSIQSEIERHLQPARCDEISAAWSE